MANNGAAGSSTPREGKGFTGTQIEGTRSRWASKKNSVADAEKDLTSHYQLQSDPEYDLGVTGDGRIRAKDPHGIYTCMMCYPLYEVRSDLRWADHVHTRAYSCNRSGRQ